MEIIRVWRLLISLEFIQIYSEYCSSIYINIDNQMHLYSLNNDVEPVFADFPQSLLGDESNLYLLNSFISKWYLKLTSVIQINNYLTYKN